MREFLDYLKTNKHKAENTVIAYQRDIKAFENYLAESRSKGLDECSESDAIAYVMSLGEAKKSRATINRKTSSLRSFYEFKVNKGLRSDNPFDKIKTSYKDQRTVDYLTLEEIEKLIAATDDSFKGLRDKALMEFMYGTGARVTEVVRLQFQDINFAMGFVNLKDADDASRIVPFGEYAKEAVMEYVNKSFREYKKREPEAEDYVFVNFRGEGLTRQGIWKILKDYGEVTGLSDRMSPQIFRDSFAVHILQRGGDLKTLQELMGFDDMSVGIAYLAVTDIHVRDVYKRCHPRA